jgi:protein phosphatase
MSGMSTARPVAAREVPKVEHAGASEPGRVRSVNQDSHHVGQLGKGQVVAIVADGLGGHLTGEIASQKAVDILWRELQRGRAHPPVAMARAVQAANLAIYDHAAEHPESRGMGTTLTVVVLDDQVGLVGHVGDSRAYLIRDDTMRQLTLDHSWVADRVRQGMLTEEEARGHRWRNVVTNALGSQPQIKLDVMHFEVRPGDHILICSDGISMLLPPELLQRIVLGNPPELACQLLLEEANNRGSPDNITAVVLKVNEVTARPKRYALPADQAGEPNSVQIGESMSGIRNIEDAFPVQDIFSKLRKQAWYPYRLWLLGSLYLLLLIIVFSVWR